MPRATTTTTTTTTTLSFFSKQLQRKPAFLFCLIFVGYLLWFLATSFPSVVQRPLDGFRLRSEWNCSQIHLVADTTRDFAQPRQPNSKGNLDWAYDFLDLSQTHVPNWNQAEARYEASLDNRPFVARDQQKLCSNVTSVRRRYVSPRPKGFIARLDLEVGLPEPLEPGVGVEVALLLNGMVLWKGSLSQKNPSGKHTVILWLSLGDALDIQTNYLPATRDGCQLVTLRCSILSEETDKCESHEERQMAAKRLTEDIVATEERTRIPFLILFNSRSGSTWLVHMLRQLPGIHCEEELLWNMQEDPIGETIQHFASWPSSDIRALGFKMSPVQVFRPTVYQDFLLGQLNRRIPGQEPKIILLQRRNRVKAVVSFLRAATLDLWHQVNEGSSVAAQADSSQPVEIDLNKFQEDLRKRERDDLLLQKFTEGLRPLSRLDVYYEDMIDNPREMLKQIHEFLLGSSALDLAKVNVGVLSKLSDDDLQVSVSNWQELRSFVIQSFPNYLSQLF